MIMKRRENIFIDFDLFYFFESAEYFRLILRKTPKKLENFFEI